MEDAFIAIKKSEEEADSVLSSVLSEIEKKRVNLAQDIEKRRVGLEKKTDDILKSALAEAEANAKGKISALSAAADTQIKNENAALENSFDDSVASVLKGMGLWR